MPDFDLLTIVRPALAPCIELVGSCAGAVRYEPSTGHIPRGWIGGIGTFDAIRLVLVTAEPGDPGAGENYPDDAEAALIAYSTFARNAIETDSLRRNGRPAPFHKNLRRILDAFWPGTSLDEQLMRTLIIPAVLCSAAVSGGNVPSIVERTCGERYLMQIIDALPNATVVALGGKAEKRLRDLGRPAHLAAQHPSARPNTKPDQSWNEAAAVFHSQATDVP